MSDSARKGADHANGWEIQISGKATSSPTVHTRFKNDTTNVATPSRRAVLITRLLGGAFSFHMIATCLSHSLTQLGRRLSTRQRIPRRTTCTGAPSSSSRCSPSSTGLPSTCTGLSVLTAPQCRTRLATHCCSRHSWRTKWRCWRETIPSAVSAQCQTADCWRSAYYQSCPTSRQQHGQTLVYHVLCEGVADSTHWQDRPSHLSCIREDSDGGILPEIKFVLKSR